MPGRKASAQRWRHHLTIAVAALAVLGLTVVLRPGESFYEQLSIATAWQSLLLLTAALLVGPLQLRRGLQLPLNIYWRRDLGIWAGLTGLVHFWIGTDVSMSPVYQAAFVAVNDAGLAPETRMQFFTWGAITGLIIGVLILLLLLLSSDRALRLLGTRWWKRLQRSAYLLFVLTIVHGLAFQLLEARSLWFPGLLVLLAFVVLVLQLQGRARYLQK